MNNPPLKSERMEKVFSISERVDNNIGNMSKLMSAMTKEELQDLKIKTEQAYNILGGDFFIHSIRIALINSYLLKK